MTFKSIMPSWPLAIKVFTTLVIIRFVSSYVSPSLPQEVKRFMPSV